MGDSLFWKLAKILNIIFMVPILFLWLSIVSISLLFEYGINQSISGSFTMNGTLISNIIFLMPVILLYIFSSKFNITPDNKFFLLVVSLAIFIYLILLIMRFINSIKDKRKRHLLSLNALLFSFFIGSLDIASGIVNSRISSSNDIIFGIPNQPGKFVINLFNKIPGFFPLSQNPVLYFIENFFLTFSTIGLIYVVLIVIKITITALMTFIGNRIANYSALTREQP